MLVHAQKVSRAIQEETSENILARFVYLYPQYTYAKAKLLPYVRIHKLIKIARKEQAYQWYNLLKIALAPQQKKNHIDKLFKEFRELSEN